MRLVPESADSAGDLAAWTDRAERKTVRTRLSRGKLHLVLQRHPVDTRAGDWPSSLLTICSTASLRMPARTLLARAALQLVRLLPRAGCSTSSSSPNPLFHSSPKGGASAHPDRTALRWAGSRLDPCQPPEGADARVRFLRNDFGPHRKREAYANEHDVDREVRGRCRLRSLIRDPPPRWTDTPALGSALPCARLWAFWQVSSCRWPTPSPR